MGATSHRSSALLERDRQLDELRATFAEAAAGRGRAVVIDAPAGTGKSALLTAGSDVAQEAGLRILRARGSELEREFAFGLMRQLFGTLLATASSEERADWLAGAAGPAERIVSDTPGRPIPPGVAALHALHWLSSNVADTEPLLLAVDDAHWADASSLRALAYLVGRIADHPIALVVAFRPNEPGAPAALLDPLKGDPGVLSQELNPLGEESVARLVRERFPEADDSVCRACHVETGGNPLYVRELVRALSSNGAARRAVNIDDVRRASIPSLGDRVARRIARLGERAPQLARAMSVLGDGTSLAVAAELAEMPLSDAGRVAQQLRRIDVLAGEDPFSFSHPLVRRSVYETLSVVERNAAHTAAAALLRAEGAPAEAVAAQLAASRPAGSDLAAAAFVAAADAALGRGAPDEAQRWLQRALREGATSPPGPEIEAKLGVTALMMFDRSAITHLEQAIAGSDDSNLRVRSAAPLAVATFLAGDWERAMAVVHSARDELRASDGGSLAELVAIGLMVSAYAPPLELGVSEDELEALTRVPGWAGHALAAVRAAVAAHHGEQAVKVERLTARALEGDALLSEPDAGHWAFAHLVIALVEIDAHHDAIAVTDRVTEAARGSGSLNALVTAADHRGWAYARKGDLRSAEAELEPGLAHAIESGAPTVIASTLFYLQDLLLERAGLDNARQVVETVQLDNLSPTYMGVMLTTVRGLLRLARGERDGGIADLRGSVEISDALKMSATVSPVRSQLALALPPSEREEAAALVSRELALADACGLPRPRGVAIRAAALLERGRRQIELLEESVALLAESGAALEHARSLTELGAALRRAGNRSDAQERLRAALEVADACGADHTLSRAQDEVRAAGGRPRRFATRGVRALTPAELRVVRRAAAGEANQEIAQELFVSLKTVESHLYSAYGKLGLAGKGSRRQLAAALNGDQSTAKRRRPVVSP